MINVCGHCKISSKASFSFSMPTKVLTIKLKFNTKVKGKFRQSGRLLKNPSYHSYSCIFILQKASKMVSWIHSRFKCCFKTSLYSNNDNVCLFDSIISLVKIVNIFTTTQLKTDIFIQDNNCLKV